MCRSHRGRHAAALFALAMASSFVAHTACGSDSRRGTLPTRLTDEEFWRLSTSFSEPAGAFTHSDNLVSNEICFAHAIRRLRPMGGVYIGVGPEQNFSYIARLRPAMAFIIDIRQENRNLHLMYKALFELSADRADFVSRLFSRERPAGLGPKTSVQELFTQDETAKPAGRLYEGMPGWSASGSSTHMDFRCRPTISPGSRPRSIGSIRRARTFTTDGRTRVTLLIRPTAR